jgi:hypothetical protein
MKLAIIVLFTILFTLLPGIALLALYSPNRFFFICEKLGLGARIWLWNSNENQGKHLSFVWRWEHPVAYFYPVTRVAKLKILSDGHVRGISYCRFWWWHQDPAPSALPLWRRSEHTCWGNNYCMVDPETSEVVRELNLDEQISLLRYLHQYDDG